MNPVDPIGHGPARGCVRPVKPADLAGAEPGRRRWRFLGLAAACLGVLLLPALAVGAGFEVLNPACFSHHIERFNSMEDENITNLVSNAQSWTWLQRNIPLFECPDREVEEIYYFRWWSFRKHLVQTTNGFVITEFLPPVSHAGAFNTISCAAGHHLAEGRWLRDDRYLNDYTSFWLRSNGGKPAGKFHNLSNWLAAAVWDRWLVNGNRAFATGLLDDLVADYCAWETERRLPDGLFWQFDVRDGMEESISGSRTAKQARPTINSYMFANARAIAALARLASRTELAGEFDARAAELRRLTQEKLWNPADKFFEVRREDGAFSSAREAIGYIPWMFSLPETDKGFEAAWAQFTDPQGFRAPSGIATAERRHPQFRSHGVGTCEWDGAVWPFATSQTLRALANVLQGGLLATGDEGRGGGAIRALPVTPRDFFSAFLTYVHSQHANGRPYLGEYLDEVTGAWINGKDGHSRYYNHSTFADLLITGVIGLRPQADDEVELWPLLPEGVWDWFCLDGVRYHGRTLTLLWDKDGSRYHRGPGLHLLASGKEFAQSARLAHITGRLP